MTPQQRLFLRKAILITLNETSRDAGMPLKGDLGIGKSIIIYRPELAKVATDSNVSEEVRYLEHKGFVTPLDQSLSPELKHYAITDAGGYYLEDQNLD